MFAEYIFEADSYILHFLEDIYLMVDNLSINRCSSNPPYLVAYL